MRIAIIAVLLAVSQAPAPIPRQAPNSPARGSQDVQKNPANNQRPTAGATIQNPVTTNSNQTKTNEPTQTDAQETVVIREPVTVSVGKDWWDRGYIILTGFLVVIGAFTLAGIWYQARETARAASAGADTVELVRQQVGFMEQQTTAVVIAASAAQRSAEAAKQSAEAAINAERPWIEVTGRAAPALTLGSGVHMFQCENRGRTPAKFISGTVDHIFVDTADELPIPPVYRSAFNSPNQTFLAPNQHFDIEPFVNPGAIIQQRSIGEAIFNPNQILIFYGRIFYEDILTGAEHETRWCYAWLNAHGFVRTGPDGEDRDKQYNDYT